MQKIADKYIRRLSRVFVAAIALWYVADNVWAAGLKIANSPSDKVAVVPRPAPTDVELIKNLAELGASQAVLFPKGADVAQFIADKCGRPLASYKIHPAYEKILLEKNSGLRHEDLHSLPVERALVIPACAKFAEGVALPAPKGVEKLAKQLTIAFDAGVFERVVKDPELRKAVQKQYALALEAGAQSFDDFSKTICSTTPDASWPGDVTSCKNAIQIALANPQITKPNQVKEVVVPASAQIGSTLEPSVTAPKDTRVALRTNLPETEVREAFPQLQDLEGQLKFVTEVEDVESFGESCAKAVERKGERWPYSVRDFLRVVSLNGSLNQDPQGRRILIVDTGFDFSDPAPTDPRPVDLVFDPYYFYRLNKASDSDPQKDANEDGVKGNGGWAGVNLSGVVGKTSSATSIVYKHRSHGLSVAALALGGRPVEELRRFARLPLRLGFVSLVALDTINPSLNTGHVEKALKFAAAAGNEFHVVNLSLSSKDTIPGWESLVSTKGAGRVFVVAAGNDGKPLKGGDAVWPAAFGGDNLPPDNPSGAVVSVGAHDSDGNIALFSNRGLKVDVLAPGCSVPSYELRLDSDKRAIGIVPKNETGTSFAAPLVSFVSALLMNSPKLASRPGIVKARILISSDYNWALKDDVYSSGILNIAKVLSIDNDVLEVSDAAPGKSRTVRYGNVLNKKEIGNIECQPGGDVIAFETAHKIARSDSNNLLVFTSDDDTKPAKLARKFCAPSMLDKLELQFRDAETGETTRLSGTSVLDYISAL